MVILEKLYNFVFQVVIADDKAIGWSGTISASIPDATATIPAKVVAPLRCDSLQASNMFT